MANRYWVGDGGLWSDTNHWSTSSGGASGASVPTSSDNVYFDANSFTTTGQAVTINTAAVCQDMDWTGVTNNPALTPQDATSLNISGNLKFVSGMTITNGFLNFAVTFSATTTGKTIEMAGKAWGSVWTGQGIRFNGSGGGWTLLDNFSTGATNCTITVVNGTLNTNGVEINTRSFSIGSGATVNLGSSTIYTFAWSIAGTLNAGTSHIKLGSQAAGGSNGFTFAGGGRTYYDLTVLANCDNEIFTGSNTFHDFTIEPKPTDGTHTTKFAPGTTQTVTNAISMNGASATRLVTIRSNTDGSQFNLVKPNNDVSFSYVDAKDSNVSGGMWRQSTGFVDSGNNTGWGTQTSDIQKTAQYLVASDSALLGSSVETYYVDASDSGPTDNDSAWTNDANAFNGSISNYAEATAVGSFSTNELTGVGTNAPGSGGTITQVRTRIYGQARDASSYVYAYVAYGAGDATPYIFGNTIGYSDWEVMDSPSGGWTWDKIQAISASIYLQGSGTANTGKIYAIEIEVTQDVEGLSSEYVVGALVDVTKSAEYDVATIGNITKDAEYRVIDDVDVTKSADYDVARTSDVTKSAEYDIIIPQINVFETDWLKPLSGTNDSSYGDFAWTNPVNIEDGNAGYAHIFRLQGAEQIFHKTLKLVTGGVVGGDNLGDDATELNPFSLTSYTYGDQTENWGQTLTPAIVNADDFGVVLSVRNHSLDFSTDDETNYLKGLNYAPNIPTANVTVLGVEARVTAQFTNVGGGVDRCEYYDLELKIHYKITLVWESHNDSQGYALFDQTVFPETDMTKSYQYEVFDTSGNFVGEWKDVLTEPKVINALNSVPGDLRIELGRTIGEVPKIVETIDTEDDEPILDNYEQEIYGQFLDTQTLGSGSDLDVDFNVNVNEYFGGFEPLVNENDEPILTPDLQHIGIPVGFPHGRRFYNGFVSNFGIQYAGAQSKVLVRLLHHAEELNNEIYKTADVLQITSYYTGDNNSYVQFGGSFFDEDTENVAQTFQTTDAFLLGSLAAKISGWTGNVISVTLRTGATPGSGTVLGTAQATIAGNVANPVQKLMFQFLTPIQLSATTSYNLVFSASLSKTHGSGGHTAFMYLGSALANAQAYRSGNESAANTFTALTPAGTDYSIELYSYGGDTTVQHNSVDPTEIFESIMDYNRSAGGIMTYTEAGVETTNTRVSAKFNMNTIREALDYNLKLSPSDWYYYIDSGGLEVEYRLKSSLLSHEFRLGENIVDVEVNKSIESLVNILYFTGGANNPFISDTFIDTTGKDLVNHTSNSNHSWVKHPNNVGTIVISSENRIYPSITGGETIYYSTAESLSDDYSVFWDYYQKSYTADFAVAGRMSKTAQTFYMARIQPGSNQYQLYRCLAGAFTLIGSATYANPGNGTTSRCELRMIGSKISFIVDGKTMVEVTDTTIPTGKVSGFRAAGTALTDSTGLHIDNFYATSDLNSKTNILRKYQDEDSITAYRKSLRKVSDNRVTDFTSADILGNAEVEQFNEPLFAARCRILRYNLSGIVKPGQLVKMTGFGNFIDDIEFQVMRVVTTPTLYELELGLMMPKVTKRVEDIKRNLNLVEQQNNPTAPQ